MGSYDQKAGDPKKQPNAAESSILDFLDKEMAASAKSQDEANAQQDDVDMLVDNLLKQTINASDEEAAPPDAGSEDLKSLFSSIFRSEDQPIEIKPKGPAPALDPRLSKTLKEVGVVDRESVNLRAVQKPFNREVASALSPEVPLPRETVRHPASPPSTREKPTEHPRLNRAVGSETIKASTGKAADLAPASRAPHRKGLVLALTAALVCLLAGVGIVHFTGMKGSPANKPAGTTQVANQTNPVTAAEQPANTPSSAATEPAADSGAARHTQHANAPATSEVSKNARNSEPTKQTKPEITTPPVSAPPANTGASGNTQVETAEKPAAPTTTAVEKPAANPPPRTTENVAPPTPVETQAPPIQATAHSVSPVLSDLDRLAGAEKSVAQPALPSRNIVPAVAITKVPPTYPDVARKTHTTGTVVVEVSIDEHGKVTGATANSGPMMLREEAVKAAMKWQFKPASINGTNVPSTSKITLVFTNPQL
jgi:protein TonB